MMLLPNQIENDFDQFFSQLNFKRVTEIIGESPEFNNADYINEKDKIIIELKVIDKDHFHSGGIIYNLNAIITVPENIDENGLGQYSFELPKERRGKHDSIEESLKRVLKKANKQLKETNNRLLNGEGVGFVLMVMNSYTSIDPNFINELIKDILGRENSSTSGFILISAPLNSEYSQYPNAYVFPNTVFGVEKHIHDYCVMVAEKWGIYFNNKKT